MGHLIQYIFNPVLLIDKQTAFRKGTGFILVLKGLLCDLMILGWENFVYVSSVFFIVKVLIVSALPLSLLERFVLTH